VFVVVEQRAAAATVRAALVQALAKRRTKAGSGAVIRPIPTAPLVAEDEEQ
jgi:hypothetical protein